MTIMRCFIVTGMAMLGMAGLNAEPIGFYSTGDRDFVFSVSGQFGLQYGTAKEFVYDKSYTVSELDWPLQPLWDWGLSLDFAFKAGFFVNLRAVSGLPGNGGTATDSDFMNGDGVTTHFSAQDGLIEGALTLEGTAGWNFVLLTELTLTPYLGFQHRYLRWTGVDGYLQYPPEYGPPYTPWSADKAKTTVTGPAIGYAQTYYLPIIGCSLAWTPIPSLAISGGLEFSPYLWARNTDNHYLRKVTFKDDLSGGYALKPELGVRLAITPDFSASLSLGYQAIGGLRGDSTAITGGLGGSYSVVFANGAGASLDVFEVGLILEIGMGSGPTAARQAE